MTNKIKVAIVDDHTLMRDALASSLHEIEDIQVIGSFSSGEEIVSKLRVVNPEVVIMDIIMKGMNGIETTRWLKERNPGLKIILLSGEVKKEFVKAGVQAGIDGYLPKDVEKLVLLKAIRTVMNGEKFFNEAITTLVFEDFYQKEKATSNVRQQLMTTDLTKRELEVFRLIANGRSNKEVADELFISIKTVDTHKSHILEKLGLKNTAEMVKYAIKNKLISDE
jgi:DNA-binding NarL/FixJ family response regulator